MQGGIFFSEAKKGYNKEEVQAFLKKFDEENKEMLQRKDDEQKCLLNENNAMKENYEKRIAELEAQLAEKASACKENSAKYEELCARMGEKLLIADSQAAAIIEKAEAKSRAIDEETSKKAAQMLAEVSAKAREDAAAVLRAAEILKQKSMLINSGLDQTKRILDDAIIQIEKAVNNAQA